MLVRNKSEKEGSEWIQSTNWLFVKGPQRHSVRIRKFIELLLLSIVHCSCHTVYSRITMLCQVSSLEFFFFKNLNICKGCLCNSKDSFWSTLFNQIYNVLTNHCSITIFRWYFWDSISLMTGWRLTILSSWPVISTHFLTSSIPPCRLSVAIIVK